MDNKFDKLIAKFKAIKEELNKNVNQSYGDGANMAMAEKNPDKKQDADLGEEVEKLVERHMKDNKTAERKEGHKWVAKAADEMMKWSEHGQWKLDKGAVFVPSKGDGKAEAGRKAYNAKVLAGMQPKPAAPIAPKLKVI